VRFGCTSLRETADILAMSLLAKTVATVVCCMSADGLCSCSDVMMAVDRTLLKCCVQSPMIRRESAAANREMSVDQTAMREGLMSTLGVSWPNGAGSVAAQHDSSYTVDVDTELVTSPPPPPNVHLCTLPLLGRVQVTG